MVRVLTEEYAWNETIYKSLLKSKKDGDIMAVGLYHFGKIIDVQKVENNSPYIKVTFEKIELNEE